MMTFIVFYDKFPSNGWGPGEGQNRGTPIRTQVETREYLIFEESKNRKNRG